MTGPGSRLQAAVEVMDRLRSPGGCPWDAEQTHLSLAPYLLEEAYETLEAIETGDPQALREELGDLLLQVLFHARLAEEATPDQRFTIEDVAGDLVAKLVRRHPHVFADTAAESAEVVAANWEQIKQAEKNRQSVTDGVPLGQPALALAAKLVSRAERAGLPVPADSPVPADNAVPADSPVPADTGIGARLLALVAEAVQAGIDPEQALRQSARDYRSTIQAAEQAARNTRDGG